MSNELILIKESGEYHYTHKKSITMKKNYTLLIVFLLSTGNLFAQQWVWDEIYEEQHSTPAENPILGIIGLGALIFFIWLISSIIKYGKKEQSRKKENRKKNEKKNY